ncbi:MAG TPA: EamA family transporter RarD [Polyangiaceae bacterium]|nr:EamA family transporter RarD [Polyangiaceae bacterium]
MARAAPDRRSGVLAVLGAYTSWGLFPLYFKALRAHPLEVLVHRILWSALFLLAINGLQRRWDWLRTALRSPGMLLGSLLSASLLSANWFVYIWAVSVNRVIDASLGYFITPLVQVVFGVLLLREALRPVQRMALCTAALGVLWLTLKFGQLPWVGLALAASFGSYAALRKTARLGALEGLALETWLLFPLAAGCWFWLAREGQSGFFQDGSAQQLALLAAGPITSVPLLLFAAGARRIPLSLAGVLQYISPTLQLLLGIVIWHEPFQLDKLVGYALIWLALLIYSAESLWVWRRGLGARALSAERAAAFSDQTPSVALPPDPEAADSR